MLTLPEIGIISKVFNSFFGSLFKVDQFEQNQREKRFNEIFKPTYDTFNTIHSEYIRLIDFCVRALPGKSGDFIHVPEIDEFKKKEESNFLFSNHSELDYQKRIQFIKEFVDKERDKNDFNRIRVRSECTSILSRSDNVNERRFLVAIFNYFLRFDNHLISDKELDDWANKLSEENGNNRYTDTPSFVIKTKIAKMVDSSEIELVLKQARYDLNDYYPQVAMTYATLQSTIYE